VIDSTTYEEAPAHFGPWLRQRTRWFKGWIRPVNKIDFSRLINVLGVLKTHLVTPIATLSQHRNEFRAIIAPLPVVAGSYAPCSLFTLHRGLTLRPA
jgi:cellulose synthase/poly-beta-1,6-N-acetylglucosamine synthase-like glycosyltransferase